MGFPQMSSKLAIRGVAIATHNEKTNYILLTKLFKADLATDSARDDVIFW
jgi:hypothetical protein